MSRIRKDTEAMEPDERPTRTTTGNGLPWWVSPPPYVKPADDELCGEPLEDGSGFCRKTIAQHRVEFRAFGERIARRVVRL